MQLDFCHGRLGSYRHATRSFALAGALLTGVITVSALTGASPVGEGAVVKVLFLSGLGWGTFRAARRQQSVVKVQRRTETGEAPSWQGEKRENTGSIRPMNNTARGDAAPVEGSWTLTTGC